MGHDAIALDRGVPIGRVTFVAYNDCAAALTKGEIVTVDTDLNGTTNHATTGPPGSKTSGYANVRDVAATDLDAPFILAVALEDIALNGVGQFGLRGHFDKIQHAGATTAIGDMFGLDATTPANQIDSGSAPAAGDRYFVRFTEVVATTVAGSGYFDGMGLGMNHA